MQPSSMTFIKRVLARLNMPYPLGVVVHRGQPCVAGSTEDHGPLFLAAPPYREATEILPGPGGSMSLVADSEHPGDLYAIMGCFLGYKFQTGAIYRIHPEADGWASAKILDLPFAHRIDFVNRGTGRYLVAASLAADKRDPADWSQPGTVYACPVPTRAADPWPLVPVLEGIHRNHGLLVTRFMGRRSLLISGTEGLFAADLDQTGNRWSFEQVMTDEISEIAVSDIDNDGEDELITIEPFHGSRLRAYKAQSNRWTKAWETEVEFGHCLVAGKVDGAPVILTSNRAGARDLLLFAFHKTASGARKAFAEPARIVVDPGAGAANMLLLGYDGNDYIFSTNQAAGEIVMYEAMP